MNSKFEDDNGNKMGSNSYKIRPNAAGSSFQTVDVEFQMPHTLNFTPLSCHQRTNTTSKSLVARQQAIPTIALTKLPASGGDRSRLR